MAERERDGIVCTVSPCCAGYWLAFSVDVDVDVDGDGDGDVNVAVHVGGLLSLFLVVGCRLAGFWLLVAGCWWLVCCLVLLRHTHRMSTDKFRWHVPAVFSSFARLKINQLKAFIS